MKRYMPFVLLLVAVCVTASAQTFDREVLVQTSTIDALLDGVYDGELTYAELSRYGDFGIGTFEGLDGEMIAFDGAIWQVKSDGKAYCGHHEPFADHLREHSFSGCTESHAQADLVCALRDCIRDHAVHADGGEEQRQESEHAEQYGDKPVAVD